jgi:hypothetical protein
MLPGRLPETPAGGWAEPERLPPLTCVKAALARKCRLLTGQRLTTSFHCAPV